MSGAHQHIERLIRRPLTWLLCLKHMAERPIVHLVQYLDGGSKDPNCLSDGPLGRGILSLDSIQGAFVRFHRIYCPYFHDIDPDMLKEQDDIKTAYNFWKSIHTGTPMDYLEKKLPVPIHNARRVI